jgi:hypothetical protein
MLANSCSVAEWQQYWLTTETCPPNRQRYRMLTLGLCCDAMSPTQYPVMLNLKKVSLDQSEQCARPTTARNLTLRGYEVIRRFNNISPGDRVISGEFIPTLRVPESLFVNLTAVERNRRFQNLRMNKAAWTRLNPIE